VWRAQLTGEPRAFTEYGQRLAEAASCHQDHALGMAQPDGDRRLRDVAEDRFAAVEPALGLGHEPAIAQDPAEGHVRRRGDAVLRPADALGEAHRVA